MTTRSRRRRTKRIASLPVELRYFRAFADGSGVDCLIDVGPFKYACHVLGTARSVHLLNSGSWSYQDSIAAADRARAAFGEALATLPPDWHAANLAMYAPG